MKKKLLLMIPALALTTLVVTSFKPKPPVPKNFEGTIKVARVVDGDTIEIETGQKVRYVGVDTPETVHPNKPVQCFGREASKKNKELVEGKIVLLKKDVSEIDRYGRLLRFVYLEDPSINSGQAIFVNDYLVRQGYAQAVTFAPDVKFQKQFLQAQREARENNRGLWNGCP